MNALWAIVVDTWRQSRQQAVFVVLLVLLGLVSMVAIGLPQPFDQGDGSRRIGFVFEDEPSPLLEEAWIMLYARTLVADEGDGVDASAAQMEAMRDAALAKAATPVDQRAVEMILYGVASTLFSVSMALFLAACAGYVPNMLEAGAIDIVLARPLTRRRIYLAKLLGGLALYTAAVTLTYLVIFFGVGLRTGVWVGRLFFVLPLQIFCAALLYSILAALGVVSRSSTLCLVVGLVFYFVVDTVIGGLISLQEFGSFGGGWLDAVTQLLRWGLPNFGVLKGNAVSSVLNIPLMQWEPFAVALVWLGLSLWFGLWRFSRADY